MSAFVCSRCTEVIKNPYDQYRERLEYVRVDMNHRPHVVTLRQLCKDCVEEVWEERFPKAAEQPTLL